MEQRMQQPMMLTLDLSKIKDIQKVEVDDNAVLVQMIKDTNSKIILPESVDTSSYNTLKIVKVGDKVTKYKAGQIVISFKTERGIVFIKHNEDNYLLSDSYNISLVTTEDNLIK